MAAAELKKFTSLFIKNQEQDPDTVELLPLEPEPSSSATMSNEGGSGYNSWIPNVWNNAVQEDPWMPAMTKQQRLMGFMAFLLGGWLCFGLSIIYIPFILIKARKYVLLFSLGSVFTLGSFSMLWGPWNHLTHLLKRNRLPFTVSYFSTLFLTIYTAMVMKSTVLTVLCAAAQFVALMWYVFSYVPGGVTGLKFFTKLFSRAVLKKAQSTLPI